MAYNLTLQDQLFFKIKTLEFKIKQCEQKPLDNEPIEMNIHSGKIRGCKRLTLYNKLYYSFERIPYALPPLGDLRFKAPKPITTWKGILDCTIYGEKPMQTCIFDSKNIEGSEDCLFVNVYTNNLKPSKPRSIMVWIYGGAFKYGEANREWYGPDYFMEKDVILITLQYRLGALGFLSLKDPTLEIPGYTGLKDIVLALKWVKMNAINFGGNPDCITLFGVSAGAAAAHILMLSENARGLFQRAILQSGTALGDWAICNSTERVYDLALAAGYKGEYKEKDILKYLLSIPASNIVQAENRCIKRNDREVLAFCPSIEHYETTDTIFSTPLEQLLDNAWSNSIPLILGANTLEGLFFWKNAVKTNALKLLKTCTQYVPKSAASKPDSAECLEIGLKLRQLHVKGLEPTLNDFFEILGYSYFWHPIQKIIDARLQSNQNTSTFLYRFDFNSSKLVNPYSLMFAPDNENDIATSDGVAHTVELAFLFSTILAKRMEQQSREFLCIQRMIGLWTQFAETGNPNNQQIPGMEGVKWNSLQRHDIDSYKCLNIDDNLKYTNLAEMQKLNVWKSLYDKHRIPPTNDK